jgi:hypothetical protein
MAKHKKPLKKKHAPGKVDPERAKRFVDDSLEFITISPPAEHKVAKSINEAFMEFAPETLDVEEIMHQLLT